MLIILKPNKHTFIFEINKLKKIVLGQMLRNEKDFTTLL